MYQKDYIMRDIEQLSGVLAKILFNKTVKNYAQALMEIEAALQNLTGADPNDIMKKNEDELLAMLMVKGSLDAEKALIIAELLREKADIMELENGFTDTVLTTNQKSLFLYSKALMQRKEFRTLSQLEKIQTVVDKIAKYKIPGHIQYALFQYFELIGDFGKAEDALFELITLNHPDILKEGIEFYNRLINKPDKYLEDGNLPRSEVIEGLAHLQELSCK